MHPILTVPPPGLDRHGFGNSGSADRFVCIIHRVESGRLFQISSKPRQWTRTHRLSPMSTVTLMSVMPRSPRHCHFSMRIAANIALLDLVRKLIERRPSVGRPFFLCFILPLISQAYEGDQ